MTSSRPHIEVTPAAKKNIYFKKFQAIAHTIQTTEAEIFLRFLPYGSKVQINLLVN